MEVEDVVFFFIEGIVVLFESSKKCFGVLVDVFVGQQQVVIKSLEEYYCKVVGIVGVIIMGDGKVVFIIDVDFIVIMYIFS